MAYSGGKITSPVEMDDIGLALGVESRDLAMLCQSDNINCWAKCKPIRYNTVGLIVEQQRGSVNFGMDVPYGFYNIVLDIMPVWKYLKPRGAQVSPIEWFRMLDFDGYNTNAGSPDIHLFAGDPPINREIEIRANIYDGEELSFSDFSAPENFSSSSPISKLSTFDICFLMAIGGDFFIYRTGVTPATTIVTASIPTSISSRYSLGTKVQIAVCLCKDKSLPVGDWRAQTAGQQLTSGCIVSLKVDSATVVYYEGRIIKIENFPGARVGGVVKHLPVSGANYYSFLITMLCKDTPSTPKTGPYRFSATLRIDRNGTTAAERQIAIEDITGHWYSGTSEYMFDFNDGGEVRTSPLITTQSGDKLYIDIRYLPQVGDSELIASALFYTYP